MQSLVYSTIYANLFASESLFYPGNDIHTVGKTTEDYMLGALEAASTLLKKNITIFIFTSGRITVGRKKQYVIL